MKRVVLIGLSILFTTSLLLSQTNVRAWYAQGQVWIVWEIDDLPLPLTYAVYKGDSAFTSTDDAQLLGRPFRSEYLPAELKLQVQDSTITYTIPAADGTTYTLAANEALFVETVEETGQAWYAVTEWGETAAEAGNNETPSSVAYNFDPMEEPVNCHWQHTEIVGGGNPVKWFCMWSLGKQELEAGRPDFPVTANLPKNGMPSFFAVGEAIGMDTLNGQRIPATHWLHGGGGQATQYLPNKAKHFNIRPEHGLVVAHNDDCSRMYESTLHPYVGSSTWFGWPNIMNPFDPGYIALPGDTIYNYTQRRLLWINSWLVRAYRADPTRLSLQGYSMGSGGVLALAKAYPNVFATVSVFNNGFRHPTGEASRQMVGWAEDNLPTNLKNEDGDAFHIADFWTLNTRTSSVRDWPMLFVWAGKNDSNERMHWGPDVVAAYRLADSLGTGMQLYWDERPHTYGNLGMHWIHDFTPTGQTLWDDLTYQQEFRSNQSFPAFFRHQQDPQNHDPGLGLQGSGLGDGEDWGTWGGWHQWDAGTVTDEIGEWSVTAWLTNDAEFAADNCPYQALTADLAIRRPQQFQPLEGTLLQWSVTRETDGILLQEGSLIVGTRDLVVLPAATVLREDQSRVRIRAWNPNLVRTQAPVGQQLDIYPNPAGDLLKLALPDGVVNGRLVFRDIMGRPILTASLEGQMTENAVALNSLPAGTYTVQLVTSDGELYLSELVVE